MRSSDINKYVLRKGEVDRDKTTLYSKERTQGVSPFVFEHATGQASDESEMDPAQSNQAEYPKAQAGTPAPSPEEMEAQKDEAYQRGLEEGSKEGQAQLERIEERMDGALTTLQKALLNTQTNATKESIKLAVMLAEKLVRRSLRADPEALAETVTSAFPQGSTEPLKVVCDSATASAMRNQITALTESLELKSIEIEEDQNLGTGDLMLFSGSTALDARVETRLKRLEKALERELGLDVDS